MKILKQFLEKIKSVIKSIKKMMWLGIFVLIAFQFSGCTVVKRDCQCHPPKAVIEVKGV